MISSVTSHRYEFYNSDFKQHFRKRSFDQVVEETEVQARSAYKNKKIKTTSVNALMPQQTTQSAETSFSLHMRTNYTPLSKNIINLRDVENDVETNSSSDIPRIIDLSTGEFLEPVSLIEELQKNRKSKRPIELIENQGGLLSIGTSSENNDDLIDESSFNSHKRIRVSKEYNFIEEEGEIDAIVHEPVIDTTKGLKIGSFNETNSVNFLQSSQSLSLYGKNSPNIKFTVPYQKAMSRYMRSQFQHLNNEEFGNEKKQVILYHPKNIDYFTGSFVENDDDAEDENYSNSKISEILEEMDIEGHNGTISYVNDSHEDQMDLD